MSWLLGWLVGWLVGWLAARVGWWVAWLGRVRWLFSLLGCFVGCWLVALVGWVVGFALCRSCLNVLVLCFFGLVCVCHCACLSHLSRLFSTAGAPCSICMHSCNDAPPLIASQDMVEATDLLLTKVRGMGREICKLSHEDAMEKELKTREVNTVLEALELLPERARCHGDPGEVEGVDDRTLQGALA